MKTRSTLDVHTCIPVKRNIKPIYPKYMGIHLPEVLRPDFEQTGPAHLDLTKVKCWQHKKQKYVDSMVALELYRYLQRKGMLKNCLNLRDGEEIIKIGIRPFLKLFGYKHLYLWKSVIRHHLGWFEVPYISVEHDVSKISIKWFIMGGGSVYTKHKLPSGTLFRLIDRGGYRCDTTTCVTGLISSES